MWLFWLQIVQKSLGDGGTGRDDAFGCCCDPGNQAVVLENTPCRIRTTWPWWRRSAGTFQSFSPNDLHVCPRPRYLSYQQKRSWCCVLRPAMLRLQSPRLSERIRGLMSGNNRIMSGWRPINDLATGQVDNRWPISGRFLELITTVLRVGR